MKTEEKTNQDNSFNPTEFLRARRPHLFSDSEPSDEINLSKDFFELISYKNEINLKNREHKTSKLYSHPTLFQYIVNKVK